MAMHHCKRNVSKLCDQWSWGPFDDEICDKCWEHDEEAVTVHFSDGKYVVRFTDKAGYSILAKCMTESKAEECASLYRDALRDGQLLSADASAWS